jgi:hypothetical protein
MNKNRNKITFKKILENLKLGYYNKIYIHRICNFLFEEVY